MEKRAVQGSLPVNSRAIHYALSTLVTQTPSNTIVSCLDTSITRFFLQPDIWIYHKVSSLKFYVHPIYLRFISHGIVFNIFRIFWKKLLTFRANFFYVVVTRSGVYIGNWQEITRFSHPKADLLNFRQKLISYKVLNTFIVPHVQLNMEFL